MPDEERTDHLRARVRGQQALSGLALVALFLAFILAAALAPEHWFVKYVLIGPRRAFFFLWLLAFVVVALNLDSWLRRWRLRRLRGR